MADPKATESCKALIEALLNATERADAALAFDAIMQEIPSGLPHPDGAQRITNASQALRQALADRMTAHIRLSEFLGPEVGADDLALDDIALDD